ncbi:MAG: 50S ribosomal protein L24 [Candidatus Pacebacteria bacterium CG10_big_fil_rev_8_21_14_0_10_36_11]|nr:50S ribosomal protein L24 [Candidatus Pacearchaeota archaeon]OIP73692.1 MAG: 50S ribosomal protein L24 [Candidatus Pacebacteria bacterium CG2_30_36_39]PIR64723.1 MAG: 50S ribosomal protein L24 [Candidatus Pacebacteria bacterium CG10_big_fil_rev_8_21_14_0_10_36_11]PJC42842.1 MAG: 50S ribosomal protein L24 [Candidatus Pacebacteria bacterium CG_4_9_14_0_2_um_filter_36_8]
MKFTIGDKIIVTAGKEKGKQGEVAKVFPKENKVLIKDVNLYTKHVRPYAGKPGERVKRERPLPTANVAIINDKGQVDRIGYKVTKDGKKERVFKKTGTIIAFKKAEPTKKTAKK